MKFCSDAANLAMLHSPVWERGVIVGFLKPSKPSEKAKIHPNLLGATGAKVKGTQFGREATDSANAHCPEVEDCGNAVQNGMWNAVTKDY